MAIKKGRGWHGDKAAHQNAGSKGGLATAQTHGKDFYSKIGSVGGKISGGNFKHDPKKAAVAGRRGGQKRWKAKS
jgi:general stress protein YciG